MGSRHVGAQRTPWRLHHKIMCSASCRPQQSIGQSTVQKEEEPEETTTINSGAGQVNCGVETIKVRKSMTLRGTEDEVMDTSDKNSFRDVHRWATQKAAYIGVQVNNLVCRVFDNDPDIEKDQVDTGQYKTSISGKLLHYGPRSLGIPARDVPDGPTMVHDGLFHKLIRKNVNQVTPSTQTLKSFRAMRALKMMQKPSQHWKDITRRATFKR